MTEHRYDEAEAAAIFQRAAEAQPPRTGSTSASQGLTLAELQEIGRDVGIPEEAIALAAQTVGHADQSTARTFLGLPLGVAHTVHLDRRLSEEEWEELVVHLRETFDARGRVMSHGTLRQWTNGNLQALLEPTAGAHRFRLRTNKGGAVGMLVGGLAMAVFSGVALAAAATQGALGDAGMVSALGLLGLSGASMYGWTTYHLPRWARTRRRQMEDVAARTALTAAQGERIAAPVKAVAKLTTPP